MWLLVEDEKVKIVLVVIIVAEQYYSLNHFYCLPTPDQVKMKKEGV